MEVGGKSLSLQIFCNAWFSYNECIKKHYSVLVINSFSAETGHLAHHANAHYQVPTNL